MSEPAGPAAPRHRLLVVDDEPDLLTLYELTLLREGHDIETARSLEEARERLAAARFDVLITDLRLPDGSGLELLHELERAGDRTEKSIVVTAYGSAAHAVEALKAGAFDYLTKPVDLRQFRTVVASALGRAPAGAAPLTRPAAAPARPAERLPAALPAAAPGPAVGLPQTAFERLLGRSPAMRAVRERIERVARSMAPVLVQGESGTGKELVARAIHERSSRGAGPFVAINCGAIPEALIEAELFGHRKGAFTGAQEDRPGVFQAAQGGTLFLDEIGELPLPMQTRLLRAVQERAVRPVGATAELPVDVRLLSATHRDLAAEVAAGRFRQDLYYRLNVIEIPLPPLRERREDLPLLVEAVLQRLAAEAGTPPAALAPEALAALAVQPLPGNVRELENRLHRALALSHGGPLGPDDLDLPPAPAGAGAAGELAGLALRAGLAVDADGSLHSPTPPAPPVSPVAPPPPTPEQVAATFAVLLQDPVRLPERLEPWLDGIERLLLVRALELHHGNRTAAGARLGLTLRQMRYRMARLGILRPEDGGEPGEPPRPGAAS
ncbi:sigma-54-dependent Fis family transcriptional regulator [Piscinibacter sp. Jin2]|uniref:Sigma-54-dependent Fis family transcriptional regulator n=1 Tax=Aquariibacter lacus TaxID=2801332 RepID=A0A9X0XCS4_9BURK|nr:sigma-54 dependent transcriptional regulator [Piscinibacter lacus]MBL0719169.1 sigma-54-dependent Fis family transcriptional regulator [Piscinibacter lacus]